MSQEEVKKLIATLRRLSSIERKHYEAAVENSAGLEYMGTCKGEYLAYEDAARRLSEKLRAALARHPKEGRT